MGRMAACRWASDRLTKIIGHARSWSQAKGSGRGVRLSPISTTSILADVEEVEVVVAHRERATVRVGDVFLKIDADETRTDVEVAAMAMAPIPTPEILWRKPPVLALAALPGTALGRLQEPSTASAAAWAAAGAAARLLHDAPLPPSRRRRLDRRRRRARQADQPAPTGDPRGRRRRLHLPDHADQAGGVEKPAPDRPDVTLRDFRSYERLELALEPGLVLVTGANGAGKTNLLESLHVGTQGFSPRTRADQQLVRLGADGARVALAGDRDGRPLELEVTLQQSGKRAKLNGAALRSAEQLRAEVATLVFTPDRLAVVKGGPAARRAYFDRTLGRLQPGRASLPVEYAAAVGQRNAALRRVQVGLPRARPSHRGPSRSRRSGHSWSSTGATHSRSSRRPSPSVPASSACRTRRSTTPASRRRSRR